VVANDYSLMSLS